jgi:hypothetical protein
MCDAGCDGCVVQNQGGVFSSSTALSLDNVLGKTALLSLPSFLLNS